MKKKKRYKSVIQMMEDLNLSKEVQKRVKHLIAVDKSPWAKELIKNVGENSSSYFKAMDYAAIQRLPVVILEIDSLVFGKGFVIAPEIEQDFYLARKDTEKEISELCDEMDWRVTNWDFEF